MKFLGNNVTKILLSLFIIGLSTNVYAQDKASAIKAYNKALELTKAEQYEEAINMYNQAIAQAEQLGEEGNDIITRAEKQLPQVYYQMALTQYRTFQKEKTLNNLNSTIAAFQEAADISEEYGDGQRADKAENIVTQLMYSKSILQYQNNNLEDAIATLDNVIDRNANYAKAYYQKGIVVKNLNSADLDRVLDLFDQAIEVGEKTNDSKIVRQANEAAAEELVYRGARAIENKQFDRAIELLQRALNYDSTLANAYYRLAEAHNKRQNWSEAVKFAKQALEYESGGRTDQAKIYFELGTAYQGLGQQSEACSAYKNAAYGSFKSPAEHQMEYELKCESTTN